MTAAFHLSSRRFVQAAVVVVLVPAGIHLTRQSYLSNYEYYADPGNPYVYAHPNEDVIRIARRVQSVAESHPNGNNIFIEVIAPEHEYWPLPWYLRSFPNTGWWSEVSMDVPAAPVIIASASVEPDVVAKLHELPPPGERHLYVPLFDSYTALRPTVEVRGYVITELWDRYQRSLPPHSEGIN